MQDVQKGICPVLKALSALQCLGGIFDHDPIHEVVDVLEVVVEGHTVHAAVLGDIIDGDLIQRLLKQQLFQRCLQRPFCSLRHEIHPFPAAHTVPLTVVAALWGQRSKNTSFIL